MGLDIYLYRYEDREDTERKEKQYSDLSEASWNEHGEYDTITEAMKQTLRAKDKNIAASLGLKDGGEDSRKQRIENPSTKYPDHYFKVGYFRSSYNNGGINAILSRFGLPDLYEIFERERDDEYVFQPNWGTVKTKCLYVIAQLKLAPNIRCFDVSWNDFKNPNDWTIRSERDALEVYINEKSKSHGPDGYSNINGIFHHSEPLKVFGLVHGVRKMLLSEVLLPCVYVVTEGENEWYVNALEIIVETADYVLSRPDQDKYFLHWSS